MSTIDYLKTTWQFVTYSGGTSRIHERHFCFGILKMRDMPERGAMMERPNFQGFYLDTTYGWGQSALAQLVIRTYWRTFEITLVPRITLYFNYSL